MTAEQDAVTEQQIADIVAANWVSFQTIRDLMAKLEEMAWKGERVEEKEGDGLQRVHEKSGMGCEEGQTEGDGRQPVPAV